MKSVMHRLAAGTLLELPGIEVGERRDCRVHCKGFPAASPGLLGQVG